MAFDAPTIILPRDASTWVDPLSPLLLRKSDPWGSTDKDEKIWFSTANGSSVLYSHGWSSAANLIDGNTSNFASTSSGGAIATYSPGNLAFSTSTAKYVNEVRMRLVLKKTYINGPWADMVHFFWYNTSTGDEMNVRGDLKFPIDRVEASNTSATVTESGTAEWAAEYATTIFFRRVLGSERFTVAALRAALMTSRLVMRTHDSPVGYSDVSQWDVAAVGLQIEYWDTTPDTQTKYQFQVSTDNTFATTNYDTGDPTDRGGDTNYDTVPPRTLKPSSNTTYYARARAHNGTDWSGWTASPPSFEAMSIKAAEMFHDSASMINIVSQIHLPYTVSPGQWREDSTYTNTYYIDFDRSDFWPEAVIYGMEENGIDKLYTEYKKAPGRYTEAEILTAVNGDTGSLYWDEENNNRLYVHTSTGLSPPSFEGFTILFKLTISESNVDGGSAENQPGINRLMAVQDLSDHIDLPPEGKRAISACRITYNNADGWFYDKFYPGEHHLRTDGCFMWNGARHIIKAVGTSNAGTLNLDDAPILFDGYIKLDGSTLDNKTLKLESQSKILLPNQKWPKEIWTQSQYPLMSGYAVGTPRQEVFGTGHLRLPMFFITHNSTEGRSKDMRCVGREIHNVTAAYKDGVSTAFTFTDATQIINITNVGTNWANAKWTCDADGLKLSGTVAESTGDIATVLYTDSHFGTRPTGEINTASFTALTSTYPGEIRYILRSPRKANEVLNEFMKSARCSFYTWFDGKIYASLDIGDRSSRPLIPDQNTVILNETDIDHDGCKWNINMKNLANVMSYNFWTYPAPEQPAIESAEYIGINELLKAKYKIDNRTTGEVWKRDSGNLDTDDGITWMNWNREARCGKALVVATIPVSRKAWLIRPGQALVAYMRTTPDDGPGLLGAVNKDGEYQAALFIVLTVRRNLKQTGGIVEAAFIEEMTGWKKKYVPRIA